MNSAEDAKSEMVVFTYIFGCYLLTCMMALFELQVKLFQEAWERENGYFFTDNLPPYTKYAEDILRGDKGNNKP